jgi:hypothetical protein
MVLFLIVAGAVLELIGIDLALRKSTSAAVRSRHTRPDPSRRTE